MFRLDDFTIWDIIKGIVLLPFLLVLHFIQRIYLYFTKKDVKLMDELYELLDEMRYFVLYVEKGPVQLERFRIKNTPYDFHLFLNFLSYKFDEQEVMGFMVNIKENFTYRSGGHSAGGGRRYSKINYKEQGLIKDLYSQVDGAGTRFKSNKMYSNKMHFSEWVKIVESHTSTKYNLNGFEPIRKAFILLGHSKDHSRYIKAKNELLEILNTEEKLQEFLQEIEDSYVSKEVMGRLM